MRCRRLLRANGNLCRSRKQRRDSKSLNRHAQSIVAQVLLSRGCAGASRQPSNQHMEMQMNWDRVEGNWKQFKGNVKEQWGKLTDDELDQIAGKRDQLTGKIQEQYGVNKDEAE